MEAAYQLQLWQALFSSQGSEAACRGYFWSDQKGESYGKPAGAEGALEPQKLNQST